jgi:hypothetical protein
MSLHYSLSIAGSAPRDALRAKLSSVPGYQRTAQGASASGLEVFISEPTRLDIEIAEDEFGFKPGASITFRVDKEAEPLALRIRLLQGCMALLTGGTEDAVLLFNSETIVLLRRGGQIVLNPIKGFWTDEVLKVIPTPHKFETMRTL